MTFLSRTLRCLTLGALVASTGATVSLWATAARADTPQVELVPEYERVTLDNGLVILLLEHHELPLVSFELRFRGGSTLDPPGKEGLADVTLGLMRKGTDKYDATQLAEELDYLGASLDLEAALESGDVSAQFLAKDVDAGLALLQEILLRPKFAKDEVRKEIDRRIDGIREAKENPRAVLGDYYSAFLFGKHAFGRPVGGTETSLPQIKRKDIQEFHQQMVQPNHTLLAVVGDFDRADMRRRLQATFGDWPRGHAMEHHLAAPTEVPGRRVLLVDKPDATQTYFRFGNVGVAKGSPDTAVLDLVNTVFGGRFTSWLMYEMRTQNGLTYNAHSRFVEHTVPGPFYISSFTQTSETETAIDMALDILARLHEKGLSEEELDSARNYIRGQFPPEFETAGELAGAIADLEFYGLDRETINGHTRRVDAVTDDDVRRAIAAHYPLDNLSFVIIGQASEIESVVGKYGTVTRKEIIDEGY
jgi:predicted Zn-dependent peptidase